MEKILPEVKERQGSVIIDLAESQIREEYAKLDETFSKQVEKRVKERKKRELEAEKELGNIIISY